MPFDTIFLKLVVVVVVVVVVVAVVVTLSVSSQISITGAIRSEHVVAIVAAADRIATSEQIPNIFHIF